ncbi:MAG: hypothetical protein B7X02_02725, partial [Rhodospirillales bacterium 12-54-5]
MKGDYSNGVYRLDVTQTCPPTPGQPHKKPFHIPLLTGFLNAQGKELEERLISITKEHEVFEIPLPEKPTPSFLRSFSAPVKLHYAFTRAELLLLLEKDPDAFSRWEAGQKIALGVLQDLVDAHRSGKELKVEKEYLEILGKIAEDESIDPALRAQLLEMPEEGYLGQQQAVIYVDSVHAARNFLCKSIAVHNEKRFAKLLEQLTTKKEYAYTAKDVGRRALRSCALGYLAETGKSSYLDLALSLLKSANNMTDEIAALKALSHHEGSQREEGMHHFYQKWNKETLVMNKWLSIQAVSSLPGGLSRVKRLMKDPVFAINNPNKIYSLLVAFGRLNQVQFHAIDGEAYAFFADLVMDIDTRNPSVASRVVSLFNQWKRFDPKRQQLMKTQLERILKKEGISSGVFEIVTKA